MTPSSPKGLPYHITTYTQHLDTWGLAPTSLSSLLTLTFLPKPPQPQPYSPSHGCAPHLASAIAQNAFSLHVSTCRHTACCRPHFTCHHLREGCAQASVPGPPRQHVLSTQQRGLPPGTRLQVSSIRPPGLQGLFPSHLWAQASWRAQHTAGALRWAQDELYYQQLVMTLLTSPCSSSNSSFLSWWQSIFTPLWSPGLLRLRQLPVLHHEHPSWSACVSPALKTGSWGRVLLLPHESLPTAQDCWKPLWWRAHGILNTLLFIKGHNFTFPIFRKNKESDQKFCNFSFFFFFSHFLSVSLSSSPDNTRATCRPGGFFLEDDSTWSFV